MEVLVQYRQYNQITDLQAVIKQIIEQTNENSNPNHVHSVSLSLSRPVTDKGPSLL